MTIVVHHLSSSRSQRIIWLLEELGLQYEVKRYERMSNMLAPPELRKIHPLGKSPVITDGDVTVAESGAITEYLVNEYGNGRLVPRTKPDRLAYTYWLHYAEGSAMPLIVMKLLLTAAPRQAPFLLRPLVRFIFGGLLKSFVDPNLKRNLQYLEGELSKHQWFAGNEFSAADVLMSFPVEALAERSGLRQYPKLEAYLKAIHARPAYQRALETGGEYHLLS